jgi:uncharacterized protein YdaU (DUF1376 family)
MAALPWFPMYARDWLSGEGTSMMLPEQEGAFIRLLCVAWGDGSNEPSLPDDDRALAQISRLAARWKRLGGSVRAQFTPREGRLYNDKLSTVWVDQVRAYDAAIAKASAGGRARAANRRILSTTQAVPKQEPSTAYGLLNPAYTEADTDTDTETTKTEEERSSVLADPVGAFLGDYDFGPCADSVEGLIRTSRNANAVIATLRMHLTGEMGHERGTSAEIGLACQQYLANGEPFKPAFFAGFIRRSKRGVERTENRKRNAAEDRFIESESQQREAAAREAQQIKAWLQQFAEGNPERFAELQRRANAAVPAKIGLGREIIVEQQLIRLIRDEAA